MSERLFISIWQDLRIDPAKYCVQLDRDDPLTNDTFGRGQICSLSPIFSVDAAPYFPSRQDSYQIIFTCHQQPFVQIESLSSNAKQYLWLSLGLTSIIAIMPLGVENAEIAGLKGVESIYCQETWKIEAGVLTSNFGPEFGTDHAVQTDLTLPARHPSNPELKRIISELYLNFDSLFKRAKDVLPSLLPVARRMLDSTAKGVASIVAGEDEIAEIKKKGSQSTTDAARYLAIHKGNNLAVDELVQLNSALAYILSQSFYGGPPLKQNLSLISCHSLLGIGTAMKAIQRLTDFIILGFSKYPVALAIKHGYPTTSIENYLKGTGSSSSHALTPDHFLQGRGGAPQEPKLTYFSSRMGFSEQGYCVTASVQCLSSADEARRTLMTLTHELLHSHFKGLLATILASSGGNQAESMLEYARKYIALCQQLKRDGNCQSKWTVLQFLHYRLFAFADGIFAIVAKYPACSADSPSSGNSIPLGPALDAHAELTRFNNALPYMTELIVHVLDFHYFYDTSEQLYLSTLWKSWANVPGVADKIEWYILRSIVAVSVANMNGLCKGDFTDLGDLTYTGPEDLGKRFANAVASLDLILDQLCKKAGHGPMLDTVLAKLRTPTTQEWLRYAFFPSHLLAQVVKQFLYSPKLRQYFDTFDDPLADRNDAGEPVYRLDAFEFTTAPIKNPVALLRDRLARELAGQRNFGDDARSAWLFLALASLQVSN